MEELAVMGIVEVLGRLRRLLHIRADLTRDLPSLNPMYSSVLMRLTSISPSKVI
jgi:lipid A disaccharide synthetase